MSSVTIWGWVMLISNLLHGPTQSASGSGESISLPVLLTFGLIEVVIFLWGRRHPHLFEEKPFFTETEAHSLESFFGRK